MRLFNAPAWKYSAILQGLRRELSRSNASGSEPNVDHPEDRSNCQVAANNLHALPTGSQESFEFGSIHSQDAMLPNTIPRSNVQPEGNLSGHDAFSQSFFLDPHTEVLFDTLGTNDDLIPDFWSQLDSLPVGEFYVPQPSTYF